MSGSLGPSFSRPHFSVCALLRHRRRPAEAITRINQSGQTALPARHTFPSVSGRGGTVVASPTCLSWCAAFPVQYRSGVHRYPAARCQHLNYERRDFANTSSPVFFRYVRMRQPSMPDFRILAVAPISGTPHHHHERARRCCDRLALPEVFISQQGDRRKDPLYFLATEWFGFRPAFPNRITSRRGIPRQSLSR